MWITNGKERQLGEPARKNNPDDMLNAELINKLGHIVGEKHNGSRYDIETICVSSGLVRFIVCGMIDLGDIVYFSFIIGEDGVKRDVEELFTDYV